MPTATPLRPDTLLHIYYLAGTIPAGRLPSGSHYLGNWEEDDFSFLFFTSPADEEVRAVAGGSTVEHLVEEVKQCEHAQIAVDFVAGGHCSFPVGDRA